MTTQFFKHMLNIKTR